MYSFYFNKSTTSCERRHGEVRKLHKLFFFICIHPLRNEMPHLRGRSLTNKVKYIVYRWEFCWICKVTWRVYESYISFSVANRSSGRTHTQLQCIGFDTRPTPNLFVTTRERLPRCYNTWRCGLLVQRLRGDEGNFCDFVSGAGSSLTALRVRI